MSWGLIVWKTLAEKDLGVFGGQEIEETVWFCSEEGQELPGLYYQEYYQKVKEPSAQRWLDISSFVLVSSRSCSARHI